MNPVSAVKRMDPFVGYSRTRPLIMVKTVVTSLSQWLILAQQLVVTVVEVEVVPSQPDLSPKPMQAKIDACTHI
jgi:hypothetical protein